MVYGVILAGGVGKRTGLKIPKQYIEILNKPVIIYTLEAFLSFKQIDEIYIAIAKEWKSKVNEMIKKFIKPEDIKRITLVEGGKERVDTIINVEKYIIENKTITDDDIIIFHDAVRPFTNEDIIINSINCARKHGAAVAGVKAADTMLKSKDGEKVDEILDRSQIYLGQAPDTFRLKYFIELEQKLTDEQKKQITGTSQFSTFNGEPIYISESNDMNFKITTIEDVEKAISIIKGNDKK